MRCCRKAARRDARSGEPVQQWPVRDVERARALTFLAIPEAGSQSSMRGRSFSKQGRFGQPSIRPGQTRSGHGEKASANPERYCAASGKKPICTQFPERSRGAQEKTRTSTPLRELAPEASASTNSATWAGHVSGGDIGAGRPCQRVVEAAVGFSRPARRRTLLPLLALAINPSSGKT